MANQRGYVKYIVCYRINCLVAAAALVLSAAAPLAAQAPVGTRAAGMAGAFVGVADDASATYWNPAGPATGDYVSALIDLGRWWSGLADSTANAPAERQGNAMVAFSVPPLGLAYYQLRLFGTSPREAAVSTVAGREVGRRNLQVLVASVFGTTLLQSVGDHLVVGASLKVVHGSAARGGSSAVGAADALDEAGALPREGHTTGDVDLGAMATMGRVRVGVVARNLTTPSFAIGPVASDAIQLDRQVRVGGGWGSGWPGISRVIVAVDSDLTRRVTPSGDRRDVAAGVETWWRDQRLGLRGGIRGSTVGELRTVAAAGVSVRLMSLVFLDAQAAAGQADERSWSLGARLAF